MIAAAEQGSYVPMPTLKPTPVLSFLPRSITDSGDGTLFDADQMLQDLRERTMQQRIATGQEALAHSKRMIARLTSDKSSADERQLKEQQQVEELARINIELAEQVRELQGLERDKARRQEAHEGQCEEIAA